MDPLKKFFLQRILKTTKDKFSDLSREYSEVENTGPTPGDAWGQHDAMVRRGYCEAAVKNPEKNRYSNLFPFDTNRFVLEAVENETDYINASWIDIPGIQSRKLILTMAPLPTTFEEFWRMVHQSECKLVIALCRVEAGYQGCAQYFPSQVNHAQTCGRLTVTVTEEVQVDEATVQREMNIKKDGKETVTVHHEQFNSWPNYGVVENIPQLANFVKKMYQLGRDGHSPMIVHCSGGIGRSGTFTTIYAVYSLLNQYIETGDEKCLSDVLDQGAINVVSLVKTMREQRHPWMVEGKQQYSLAYSTILHLLQEIVES